MKSRRLFWDDRIKIRKFPLSSFAFTFVALAILTTIQMRILGDFIDFQRLPPQYYVAVAIYWIAVSAAFTLLTTYQINERYGKPMTQFAEAARKVAGGDFSVYVSPRHRADKLDSLDVIFLDFNTMVEELGSIETLKTDFISNVSHEIKTPISVIQNYATMLERDDLPPGTRREYAQTVAESATRLADLITNILKLNKMEYQKILPKPEHYDVCRQLCDCALHFENIWEKKGIDFIAEIEDRAEIEADESLMELVWNNLLSNAVKFTEPGGTVKLQQTSTADEIIVTVSDTGCGMSEETMNHIFDKFYQGDTSHATQGNGLGLSLVLRVLQLSGGTISVKSAPGKGAAFTVHIPSRQDQGGGEA